MRSVRRMRSAEQKVTNEAGVVSGQLSDLVRGQLSVVSCMNEPAGARGARRGTRGGSARDRG